MICQVCEKNKQEVSAIKTYNTTPVDACPSCKEDMKLTIICMKISADDSKERYGLQPTEFPTIVANGNSSF